MRTRDRRGNVADRVLAAGGPRGSAVAPGIKVTETYEFRLSSEARPELLAAVTVTRRDDVAHVLIVLGIAGFAVILVRPLQRAWLLDVGVPAAVIAAVWIKLVVIGTSLRPGYYVPSEARVVLSGTLLGLLVAFTPLLLMRRSWRLAAALALDAAITVLGVADIMHARFFDEVISFPVLASAGDLGAVVPSVMALSRPTDALYFADVVVGTVLVPFYLRQACRTPERLRDMARLLPRVLVVIGLLVLIAMPALWDSRKNFWSRRTMVAEMGVLPYHVYDAAAHALNALRATSVTAEQRAEVRRFIEDERERRRERSPLFGVAGRRSLILISAESLSAFPVGLRVNGQPVTPHLSSFAEESLHFENFFDQSFGGGTADAAFAALQGLHPLAAGSVFMRHAGNHFRALPTVAVERGYATLATGGHSGEMLNMRRMLPRLGFERMYFEEAFSVTERVLGWMPDHDFFEQTVRRLRTHRRPFMAQLFTSSGHYPYRAPSTERDLSFAQPVKGTLLEDYLRTVHYVDWAFGRFVRRLRDEGLLDDTVIAVYGDHRPFLEDWGAVVRLLGPPAPGKDGPHLEWEIRQRVPLLIRLPRGEAAGRRAVAGGHLDIAPTLLSVLGIEDARSVMLGRDLTRDGTSMVVFRDGGFTDGRHAVLAGKGPQTPARCAEIGSGRAVDCASIRARVKDAQERLKISDLIIRGDLVPELSAP